MVEQFHTHAVTLVNRSTQHEVRVLVKTASDRFSDVARAIMQYKAVNRLGGYEMFETQQITEVF